MLTTGRTGSTLLSGMLTKHPDVASLSEFFTVLGGRRIFERAPLDGRSFCKDVLLKHPPELAPLLEAAFLPEIRWSGSFPADARSPLLLVPLPGVSSRPDLLLSELLQFARDLPAADIGSHFDSVIRWLCSKLKRRVWVERSGGSLAYADLLLERWPRARVIHLFRNGSDCARSMARHPYFRLLVARLQTRNPDLAVDECLKLEIPDDRFGVYWSAVTLAGIKALSSVSKDRVLHVAYESLIKRPHDELERIFRFLEVDAGDEVIRTAAGMVVPNRYRPTPTRSDALERACLPGERGLGRMLASSRRDMIVT